MGDTLKLRRTFHAVFMIRHTASSFASIGTREEQQQGTIRGFKFQLPEPDLIIFLDNSSEEVDGIKVHVGLNIVMTIASTSEREAETESKLIVETWLNLISYSTLASCSPARLVSALEFTGEPEPRFKTNIYPFHKNTTLAAQSPIDQRELQELLLAFFRCDESEKTARALSWFRKGLNEENSVDEFIAYWSGLEVLKPLLRRQLKLQQRNVGPWDAIKQIYENEIQLGSFELIKETRNSLLHGYRPLTTEFVREIETAIDPTRRMLIAAIAHSLDLKEATRVSLLCKEPRRTREYPWVALRGELINMPLDVQDIIENFPTITGEPKTVHTIDDHGNLEVKIDLSLRFHGPDGMGYRGQLQEHRADKDTGILKIELANSSESESEAN